MKLQAIHKKVIFNFFSLPVGLGVLTLIFWALVTLYERFPSEDPPQDFGALGEAAGVLLWGAVIYCIFLGWWARHIIKDIIAYKQVKWFMITNLIILAIPIVALLDIFIHSTLP